MNEKPGFQNTEAGREFRFTAAAAAGIPASESRQRYHSRSVAEWSREGGESIPPLVATEELAGLLRCSVRTIQRRVRAGLLPPPSVASRPNRYDAKGVLRHLEGVDPFASARFAGALAWREAYRRQLRRVFR